MYQKELLKGNTDTLLLSLLSGEPMYGYQIAREVKKRSSGYFLFKESTLYPALHRLEKAELVEGHWGKAASGVPRRYYSITPKGQRVLMERLQEWQRFSKALNSAMLPQVR